MRNLRCGSEKHRFLDIKIGQKTAQVVTGDVGRVGWLRVVPEKWKTDMDRHAKRTTPDLARPGGKGNLAWRRCGRVWWMALQIRAVRAFVWRSGGWVLQGLKPENQRTCFPSSLLLGFPMLSKCVRLVWNAVSALLGLSFSCLPCWFFHLVWDAACAFLSLSLVLSLSLYSILSFTGKAETKKQKFKLHVRFLQLFGSLVVEWDC